MHVKMADEAFYIGKPPAKESYLLGDSIIDIAKKCGAKAIHPGYGFLSENAEFAEKCKENGVVFIGPPASAIRSMGSKSASKHIMQEANVPVVPGYHGDDQSIETLQSEADKIGYPVLIKAWMGGGGKGMKIVNDKKDFVSAVESARREAVSSFGDDRVLVEKYLVRPRHIEVQVFADEHGNCVYVFERDCSVQRRHQKVVEEAPAPGMTEAKRKEMGEAAVNAAKAVGYTGAGTVEFIVDEDGSFYFMEMNTRLQVEHPVSEMISKQDLVEWQLSSSSGNPLPLSQDQLQIHGHALEARIYAENPDTDFLPGTGKISFMQTPQESEHVRIDTGIRMGDEVSVFYDPMIAKLIVWDKDRASCIRRMFDALGEYKIVGLTTNISFLKKVITHDAFKSGNVDTKFIEEHKDKLLTSKERIPSSSLAIASLYSLLRETTPNAPNPWNYLSNRRFNHNFTRKLQFKQGEELLDVQISCDSISSDWMVTIGDETLRVNASLLDDNTISAEVQNHSTRATVVHKDNSLFIFHNDDVHELTIPEPSFTSSSVSSGSLLSPMPGRVIKVNVTEGQEVQEGDCLMIMEAMKMEHQIKAASAGTVSNVFFKVGDLVEAKKVLIEVKGTEDE
uniref:Methylcrotonoyl-CoA carboxylase subunit alpha, mitochondrial n=1 Tax=Vannella robusta TaxID=1487602 RepID=A0A7S4I2P4_9EUKA